MNGPFVSISTLFFSYSAAPPVRRVPGTRPWFATLKSHSTAKSWRTAGGLHLPGWGGMSTPPGRTDTFRLYAEPSCRSSAHERVGLPVPPSAFGRVRVVDR